MKNGTKKLFLTFWIISFVGCESLRRVVIPDSVRFIDADAFEQCGNLQIIGERGSAAEKYAADAGIRFATIPY